MWFDVCKLIEELSTMLQHRNDIRSNNPKTALSRYAIENDHEIVLYGVSVLHSETIKLKRKILEVISIRQCENGTLQCTVIQY